MKAKTKVKLISLSLLVTTFFTFGCYDMIRIQPREVVKLNNTYKVQVGSVRTGETTRKNIHGEYETEYEQEPIYQASVRHLIKHNGSTMSVAGSVPVIITTDKEKVELEPPLISSLENGVLKIRSSNHPPKEFELRKIKKVEVKKLNQPLTILFGTGASLVGAGLIVGLVFLLI